MSRIVGLTSQNAPARIGGMVAALSAGVAVAPRAARTLEVSAAMSLAATSHRETVTAVQHGHMTVVLDGAVYNRADLGVPDRKPVDDARLIAEMTERYGFPGALARINGDFAIALHDARDGALWLARDRMGVKPLFYATAPGLFAFASRPRDRKSVV